MSKTITGIVTWLKGWFYDKEEITSYLNNKVNLNQGSGSSNMNVVTDSSGNITVEAKPTIPTDVSQLTDNNNTAFTPKSHTHGQVTNDGKITSSAVTVASGDNILITDASDSSKIKRVDNILASHVKDGTAHTNIGSSANATQSTINTSIDTALSNKANSTHTQASSSITNSTAFDNILSGESTTLTLTDQDKINAAINTKIGEIADIKALEIVSTLPTASADTMGMLYVINENSKINFYFTRQSGTSPNFTYSWEKMDTDILDELVINWNDVQNKPSTFTPSSHTHGNINNDGTMSDTITPIMIENDVPILMYKNNAIVRANKMNVNKVVGNGTLTNLNLTGVNDQWTINSTIDTTLGTINSNKADKSTVVDWDNIVFVPKSSDATGAITLYMIGENTS